MFTRTVTSAAQLPYLLEMAVNAAYQQHGPAVLTLPGDVGQLEIPHGEQPPRFVDQHPSSTPSTEALARAAELIATAEKVTMLVGIGAREARDDVLATAKAAKPCSKPGICSSSPARSTMSKHSPNAPEEQRRCDRHSTVNSRPQRSQFSPGSEGTFIFGHGHADHLMKSPV